MHLEILVEGQSDCTALEPILSKILGPYSSLHTWRIHKHRGLGELPPDPNATPDPRNPTLLHNLPASLRAYGRTLSADQAVVVLLDLDQRDCVELKGELVAVLGHCDPKPKALFRIAIEELEAWFLGDREALLMAYPSARTELLDSYVQDSVCGTWELLADIVYPGGCRALKARTRYASAEQKRLWARDIAPRLDPHRNRSHSFRVFRDGIRRLAEPG